MELLYNIGAEELALLGGLLTCAFVWSEWQRLQQQWKQEEGAERFLRD